MKVKECNAPIITVVVLTYNHAEYISKTLDSILVQKTNVPFLLLVHDDCSNDGTSTIVKKYKKMYPENIEVIQQKTRLFDQLGFNGLILQYIVPNIKSKYVAICDGDDYWIDEFKLQKQYDFMEKNLDYSMCFHSAYQLKNDGDMSSKWYIKDEGDVGISDFISERPGICVPTSSIFIRREPFIDFPNWRFVFPVEDLPLCINAALYGRIRRLPGIMCVYRQMSNGSWSQQNLKDNSRIEIQLHQLASSMKQFDVETNQKYHSLVASYLDGCEFRLYLTTKNYKMIFSKRFKRLRKQLPLRDRISLFAAFRFGPLYHIYFKIKHKK